jgi:hypothetical protein
MKNPDQVFDKLAEQQRLAQSGAPDRNLQLWLNAA